MKDILTDEKIDHLIERLNHLEPSSARLWGRLSVNGMLRHCIIVTDAIVSSTETRKAKLKEILLMPVFYVLKKLPRGVKSADQFLDPDADALAFETERAAFRGLLISLKDHDKKIMGVHPVFGPLDTNRWRKFLLLHTDHHLRQFSV